MAIERDFHFQNSATGVIFGGIAQWQQQAHAEGNGHFKRYAV